MSTEKPEDMPATRSKWEGLPKVFRRWVVALQARTDRLVVEIEKLESKKKKLERRVREVREAESPDSRRRTQPVDSAGDRQRGEQED